MNTPYPTLNHGLDEELNMLRDTVYQFCQKELAPRATDIDRNNEFPMDLWPKLGALGVLGMTVDEAREPLTLIEIMNFPWIYGQSWEL